jgi:hypothetical protein
MTFSAIPRFGRVSICTPGNGQSLQQSIDYKLQTIQKDADEAGQVIQSQTVFLYRNTTQGASSLAFVIDDSDHREDLQTAYDMLRGSQPLPIQSFFLSTLYLSFDSFKQKREPNRPAAFLEVPEDGHQVFQPANQPEKTFFQRATDFLLYPITQKPFPSGFYMAAGSPFTQLKKLTSKAGYELESGTDYLPARSQNNP